MYKIKRTNFDEFKSLSPYSIEVGDLSCHDEYDGCTFEEIVVDGDVVAATAFDFEDEFVYMSAIILPKIRNHMKEIRTIGTKYLETFGEYPIFADVRCDFPEYAKFLCYLGFEKADKSLDYVDENGIMYKSYIRK